MARQSRREFLAATLLTAPGLLFGGAGALAAPVRSRLAVEIYIWVELLARQHRSLSDGMPEIFSTAKAAGYRNIELNSDFFTPTLASRTLSLLRKNGLKAPSVYVGGAMHEAAAGAQTAQLAMATFSAARKAGCQAIVCDPSPKPDGEKTDQELATQVKLVNRLGRELSAQGGALRFHNHKVELKSNAREWRFMLDNTEPKYLSVCLDIDWAKQAGYDPMSLLQEAGSRVTEIHIRSSRNLVWQESVAGGGDVDYGPIAAYLKRGRLEPLIVVELAYADKTVVTRPLEEDLRLSREFAEQTFELKGS